VSPTFIDLGIDQLSREDRLQLLDDIWDSLTPKTDEDIPEGLREELDRRLAAADADASPGIPWEEVRAKLWDKT